MLENIDDEDIVFLRQIYTMFKVHLQKGLITGYKEGDRKKDFVRRKEKQGE